ncbi:homoserine O-acetyltransferase [Egibacter rhizosphaerae]|uniref:Homoserine O-acetyltransferase n=1 Tax=Egibacter rhizosphaerae TaxID=1670831 RepID=A0A411YA87_9ACTN|nr:homoserine O-acetyltransferase [Egibacter rhizosphaerae]QBI18116.1 homoserine O-acetyltransferase [Egibacter rhizosphaerae]
MTTDPADASGDRARGATPASGAWGPGDPVGRRRFARTFDRSPLALEAGGALGPIDVAYETWGELAPDGDNAVLVCHALTGDSHVLGPPEPGHPEPGWWDGVVGPGAGIDTDRWFVVCANVLGGCQGTTGPASEAPDGHPYGSRWPRTTIRDQVEVEAALARHLGIEAWAAVVGGSMGGMRALEWAVTHPDRVRRAVVIGCGAQSSAEQIALSEIQIRAIRLDPGFRGGDYYDAPAGPGPHEGLGVARRLGQVTYRSERELAERFGRAPQDGEDPLAGGRYAVESYLDHQADKLARRFDANTYVALSEAMNHHDVGRGRGGTDAALARARVPVTVVGIDSDRLYPPHQQRDLVTRLPDAELAWISSLVGHDGFLVETEQVGEVLARALCP